MNIYSLPCSPLYRFVSVIFPDVGFIVLVIIVGLRTELFISFFLFVVFPFHFVGKNQHLLISHLVCCNSLHRGLSSGVRLSVLLLPHNPQRLLSDITTDIWTDTTCYCYSSPVAQWVEGNFVNLASLFSYLHREKIVRTQNEFVYYWNETLLIND